MDRLLGKGATAAVYEGRYTAPKGSQPDPSKREIPVAVKVIAKHKVDENMKKVMESEYEVINRLKHRNIVEFIILLASNNNYYYVFELVRGGDLLKSLQDRKRFTELETQALFRQFAQALAHLNMHDVVHRDLKPANIMLSDKGELKLTDFGLARIFNKQEGLMTTTFGTPFYQAPEILEGKDYDEKADMWSAGIILFQMLTGNVPFPAKSIMELHTKVMRGQYELPEDCQLSDICIHLIKSLIRVDPKQRISFKEFK